jgi:hypothetical protein
VEVEVEDANLAKQFYFIFLAINHGQKPSKSMISHD